MAKIYLIRHGEAASTWADAVDPGLSELGRTQAQAAARTLATKGPMKLISSPLARARETAEPLARTWKTNVAIANDVAEIPSPGIKLDERGAWLRKMMAGRWDETADEIKAWRQGVIDYLVNIKQDSAIFSHFIAINVAVGSALARDDVMCFSPANGSITILASAEGTLTLIETGAAGTTVVR